MMIKVCGITRSEDAALSIAGGATALGFNFYLSSPRYLKPENAFTLTQSTNSPIGVVEDFIDGSTLLVKFETRVVAVSTILTDSSGGTPSDTLPAISAGYVQAEVRDSIASLAPKVNELLDTKR